jgi:uncharacterized protein involved in exopolysaccharide biosynthesis
MERNNNPQFRIIDTLQLIKAYWGEVWSKKWYVIVGAFLLAGLLITQAWLTPKKYTAPLTFMMNEDDGKSSMGISAILGEIGFGGGGGGGQNFEKITSLATSRLILEKCFYQKVDCKGEKDFLGNHILNTQAVEFDQIQFPSFSDTGRRSDKMLELVNRLAKVVKGDPSNGREGLLSVGYDEETTILEIKAKTTIPELSIVLSNTLYDVLSAYYSESSIEKQQATYFHVRHKVDSIQGEINAAETQLARFKDQNKGLIYSQSYLPAQRLSRKLEMLYIMYGEASKNLEMAEFLLQSATPYFQVIDRPIGPFKPVGKSRAKAGIIGGLLGGLLAVAFIVGRRWFLDRLEEERVE